MSMRQPKHRAILETLQHEIIAGDFVSGRLPSEAALCARFAASRPTVARALDGLREHGLIERRAGAGTFLRRLEALHGGFFGLIGAGLGHTEVLGPIGAEIARASLPLRYRLILGESGTGERHAQKLCREFQARGVAGVFLAPLELAERREAVNRRMVGAFRAAGIPVVLIDRDLLEFPERSDLDLVAVDDVRAGFRLASHLLRRGCRSLAFVARPQWPSTTDLRLIGCREAAIRAGVPLLARAGDPADPAFIAALRRDCRCDGVICSNDQTAALLVRVLGRAVPTDILVGGFDDVRLAVPSPIPLTTMRIPFMEIGAMAVRTMLMRIREPDLPPRQILLDAQLVVRRSSGVRTAAMSSGSARLGASRPRRRAPHLS